MLRFGVKQSNVGDDAAIRLALVACTVFWTVDVHLHKY